MATRKSSSSGSLESQFLAHGRGIELHAAQVLMGGMVPGVDHHGKGFQSSPVQQGEFRRVVFAGVGPGPVAAVEREQNRQRQQSGVDAGVQARCADQIREVSGGDEPRQQRAADVAV